MTAAAVTATADILVIRNAAGENVTDQLNINQVPGKIIVNPAELTISTPSSSKVYNGKPLTAEGKVEEGVIRIRAKQVEHPAAVRYAWCDWSERVNLTGENGLPLEPFCF